MSSIVIVVRLKQALITGIIVVFLVLVGVPVAAVVEREQFATVTEARHARLSLLVGYTNAHLRCHARVGRARKSARTTANACTVAAVAHSRATIVVNVGRKLTASQTQCIECVVAGIISYRVLRLADYLAVASNGRRVVTKARRILGERIPGSQITVAAPVYANRSVGVERSTTGAPQVADADRFLANWVLKNARARDACIGLAHDWNRRALVRSGCAPVALKTCGATAASGVVIVGRPARCNASGQIDVVSATTRLIAAAKEACAGVARHVEADSKCSAELQAKRARARVVVVGARTRRCLVGARATAN